jgi:hypothetical protein
MGLVTAAQTATAPKMMEVQTKMMSRFQEAAKAKPNDPQFDPFKNVMATMTGAIPPWFGAACVALGLAGFLVNGLYIFAAIGLLQMRPSAIRLFYATAAGSILLAIVRSGMMMKAFPLLGIGAVFGGLIGAMLDLILIAVLATRPAPAPSAAI